MLLLSHHSLPSLCPLVSGCLPWGKLTFVTLTPPRPTGIRPPPQSRPACKASELRALTFPYILDLPACQRVVFLNLLWFQYRCCPDLTIRNNDVGVRNKCGGRILLDRCKVDDGRATWVLLTNDFLLKRWCQFNKYSRVVSQKNMWIHKSPQTRVEPHSNRMATCLHSFIFLTRILTLKWSFCDNSVISQFGIKSFIQSDP